MKFKQKPDLTIEKTKEDKEQLVKDFLSKADKPATFQGENTNHVIPNESLSWRDVSVKKDVTAFSFRIPKKDLQQLKYISKQSGMSLNALCLMSVQINNRKMLKEIEENQ